MDIYSKDFYLFVVQVDHLTGECIGQVIDAFYNAGASNVQVVSSITKKNRPSYMIFIDCRQDKGSVIEETIVRELQTGGWHKIRTEHCYLHNEILRYPLVIRRRNRKELFIVEGKHFIGGGIRPEHDNVMELKKYLQDKMGINLNYNLLYAYASAAIVNENGTELNLDDFADLPVCPEVAV